MSYNTCTYNVISSHCLPNDSLNATCQGEIEFDILFCFCSSKSGFVIALHALFVHISPTVVLKGLESERFC